MAAKYTHSQLVLVLTEHLNGGKARCPVDGAILTIRTGAAMLDISCPSCGAQVSHEVRDTGVGYTPQQREEIRRAFDARGTAACPLDDSRLSIRVTADQGQRVLMATCAFCGSFGICR